MFKTFKYITFFDSHDKVEIFYRPIYLIINCGQFLYIFFISTLWLKSLSTISKKALIKSWPLQEKTHLFSGKLLPSPALDLPSKWTNFRNLSPSIEKFNKEGSSSTWRNWKVVMFLILSRQLNRKSFPNKLWKLSQEDSNSTNRRQNSSTQLTK